MRFSTIFIIFVIVINFSAVMASADLFGGISDKIRDKIIETKERIKAEKELRPNLKEKIEVLRSLSPEDRKKVREAFNELKKLSADERETLKRNYELFKNLPQDKRENLKRRFEQFKRLSPEAQQRLKEFKRFSPEVKARKIQQLRKDLKFKKIEKKIRRPFRKQSGNLFRNT